MNVTQIVKPPFGAVDLRAVWQHLRVDTEGSPLESPLDATYARNILTATRDFEKSTRTSVIEQTLRLSVAGFPAIGIRLVNPPFQRIASVQYYDGSNVLQLLDAASYYVTDDLPPHLRLATGTAAPALYDRPDAVRVECVTGFAPNGSPPTLESEYQANVPSEIQDAVLLRVEYMQANTSPADRAALENAIECIESGLRIPLSQS